MGAAPRRLFETSDVYASGIAASLGDGDSLFVAKNVSVTSQSIAVYSPGSALIFNEGSIDAPADAVQFGRLDTLSTLTNTLGATIAAQFTVIDLYGAYQISNYGDIISGPYTTAIDVQAYQAGTSATIFNAGTISGGTAFYGYTESDKITNTGTINGEIDLGSGHGTFDSSEGVVHGTIRAGSGGDTIVAATNGGIVLGAAGSDSLRANQSKLSADDHVSFTLDGAGGTNALYGGGAFNTFDAGDAAGGRNLIRGSASLMGNVAGYANNTVDFSKTPSGQSAYVDLLNGHNAYLYAGATHSGALTFEDAIQNVPNVVGSAGGDLIRADNGTDVIQGGAGADILYAGTGFDTFVYSGYADSDVNGYDVISGFVTGKDKVDLSALHSDASHLAIISGSAATTFDLEATPGKFTASTDLAISFNKANAIKASDVIF